MKRSKMLEELETLLVLTEHDHSPIQYVNAEKLAVEILEFLEAAGMLPPSNSWEPEDEQ